MSAFDVLVKVNVNDHTETKNTGKASLTYLSWPWAWSEVKSRYPDATYSVWRNPDTNLPYVFDPFTGYMVSTSVTIEGTTHEMWLPVMDERNNAMKGDEYKIKTKYGETTVREASMFDVNKTIMRCLVKNLAMFGLGLYIYAGEDLPEDAEPEKQPEKKPETGLREFPKEEAPPKPELKPVKNVDGYFYCKECGGIIKTWFKNDGTAVTAEETAQMSLKYFGMQLCAKCGAKRG